MDEALAKFEAVVPFGEEAFMVLRAHLLVEQGLWTYVKSRITDTDFLKAAEHEHSPVASGRGLIFLARALSLQDEIPPSCSEVLWPALDRLNSLRNLVVHNLHPEQKELKSRMKKFVELASKESVKNGDDLNRLFYLAAQLIVAYLAIDQKPLTIEDTI